MKARNKYRVSPAHERKWRGKTYDSKAEMLYAQQLDLQMQAGDVVEVIEQPRLWLGVPENTYRPDFLVVPKGIAKRSDDWIAHPPYYVDVKGVETPAFKRIKKLWASYGRLDLHIVKRSGNGFRTVEVIEGGANA